MKSAWLFGVGAFVVFVGLSLLALLLASSLIQHASASEIGYLLASVITVTLTRTIPAMLSFFVSTRIFHRNHGPGQSFAFGCVCALIDCVAGWALSSLLIGYPLPAHVAASVVLMCAISAFIPVAFVAESPRDP
jgi:hypothetical protein